ncbi:phosphocarrier HPr family protein [Gracilibacillus halophilus YIM-C55.5]|uniref:Phosphocarrier HPr family protein n=1 Tax=Gracilibacillus halophilus YIM-C55.5 TaxID=1308866 RepID=N4WA59_9BACI|nr:HPr family phosphocarrier protein [Gracilibacillus halophilus]ENH96144.1 phosphocarrier HPr family protein [Gracilibacillus halophilus YIM-C55.5]
MSEFSKNTTINISESQTIVELSYLLQKYESEVFILNKSENHVQEINPKSVLGLATLQLKNGIEVTVRAVGNDAEDAVMEVVNFFQGKK